MNKTNMKKIKCQSNLICLFICIMLCSLFAGCNDEDDIKGDNSMIVGRWAESSKYEQFVFNFFKDGSGRLDVVIDYGKQVDSEAFTYSFNPQTMEIVFNYEFDSGDDPVAKIEMTGNNAMILTTYDDYESNKICERFHLYKEVGSD